MANQDCPCRKKGEGQLVLLGGEKRGGLASKSKGEEKTESFGGFRRRGEGGEGPP